MNKNKTFILSLLLCLTMLLSTTVAVYATDININIKEDSREKDSSYHNFDVNYEITENDIHAVRELMADGLSEDEAEYYIKLDKLVNYLENTGQELDVSEAENLSDEYVRANPKEFRNRILNGDKVAIKKGILNQAYLNGEKDMQNLIKEYKSKGQKLNKYTVRYSDGSSVSVVCETVKINEASNQLETNTNVTGPWNRSTHIENRGINGGAGDYYSSTEWIYKSGVNYSKVKDTIRFNWNGNLTATYQSDTGAAASYGIVSIANEVLSNNINSSSYDLNGMAGYTDVRFKVSGAFSASYLGMGINLNAGGTWHQYAVTEVFGAGFTNHWAAQYI